ncbi:protein of unknown function [Lishizhenia tianjinensis]|uniref:DUF4301 domain-containing protein n=1 Tax=Lishizhenia tianjinensis TaxID=477690 RepID=A0A1I7APT2_9FLAO|nr:DUF4301 family protein [Lishizhenia tianjinensis]SFT76942.1 protein of unknown function [Lishizhenia tianjinensis]
MIDLEKSIEKQREEVFSKHPEVKLHSVCKLNDGVIKHNKIERNYFKTVYADTDLKTAVFIPASGSGSRMFQFLYDFLSSPSEEDRGKVERFFSNLKKFAFFELLPFELKKRIAKYDYEVEEIIHFILEKEGLNLGSLPKGLIPFHRNGRFILNAFQEQVLQAIRLKEDELHFHFTINKNFEEQITTSLLSVQHLTGLNLNVTFSEQSPATNAVAFNSNGTVVKTEEGEILTRPSGHGALLQNLNSLQEDLIFIKNIDNVQHENLSETSVDSLKYMAGLLLEFKKDMQEALKSNTPKIALAKLNQEYQFAPLEEDFETFEEEELLAFMNRPMRVCGMVRNEGQPGGGPFWVEDESGVSKQIVEKAQISPKGDQYNKMVQSQYFNPVMMVLNPQDLAGNKLDLDEYVDKDKYFVVDKAYKGVNIKFRENPGLWNGGMANWNTLFVEVPSESFSPVKTVLDLLDASHLDR